MVPEACNEKSATTQTADTTRTVAQTGAEEFIHNFYMAYIGAHLKMPVDYQQVDALVDASCSNTLIAYLDTADLDYDPFLNAQDVVEAWQTHVTIVKHDSLPLCFWVHLDDPANSNASAIILIRLRQEATTFKIDQVLE
jgi:hypothetical protein